MFQMHTSLLEGRTDYKIYIILVYINYEILYTLNVHFYFYCNKKHLCHFSHQLWEHMYIFKKSSTYVLNWHSHILCRGSVHNSLMQKQNNLKFWIYAFYVDIYSLIHIYSEDCIWVNGCPLIDNFLFFFQTIVLTHHIICQLHLYRMKASS